MNISMKRWTAKQVKALRSRLGLSQAKMAERIGVSENYVYMLEKGERRPGKFLCLLLDSMKGQSVRGVSTGQLDRGRKK
jgi:DNA-binding XRE family transcriptional regulator